MKEKYFFIFSNNLFLQIYLFYSLSCQLSYDNWFSKIFVNLKVFQIVFFLSRTNSKLASCWMFIQQKFVQQKFVQQKFVWQKFVWHPTPHPPPRHDDRGDGGDGSNGRDVGDGGVQRRRSCHHGGTNKQTRKDRTSQPTDARRLRGAKILNWFLKIL